MNKTILSILLGVVILGGVWYFQQSSSTPKEVIPSASPTPSVVASVSPTPTPVVSQKPRPSAMPTPNQNPTMKEVRIITVAMKAGAFEPVALTVHQGDVVEFVNMDTTAHIVKSDNSVIYSGTIESNGTWNLLTATVPKGTYEYHCTLHPSMRATLTIN